MANKVTNTDNYTAIANAIRSKNGETDTYTPAEMADAIGRISQGGGYGYTLLGSAEFTVNTTSTTTIDVGDMEIGPSAYTSAKIIYIKSRDKAGKRQGYYFGCDAFFVNIYPAIEGNTAANTAVYVIYRTRSGSRTASSSVNTTIYGVSAVNINNAGKVAIKARYSSSTLTIDGTFKVDVYALDWPNGVSPFY